MDKPWLGAYPKGIPETIPIDNQETLVSLFQQSCTQYADNVAFTCQGAKMCYRQLAEQSHALACYYQYHLKLNKGDRLAVMLPNLLQYPVVIFAALQAGLIIVNLNPLDKAHSLKHELIDSQARVMVVAENFVNELTKVVDQTQLEKVIITSIGALYSPIKRLIINAVVRHIKRLSPPWKPIHGIRFRQALTLGEAAKPYWQNVELTGQDLAFLQYTSGTTGKAKGVMLSHGNMMANIKQCVAWVYHHLDDKQNRIITPLPLYHVFSLMANCLVFIAIGGENILIPNPRDITGFIKTLRRSQFTGITGVNTLFNALLNHPDFKQCDFSHLRITLGGGMAVQSDVAKRWHRVTGCHLSQGYGLSETSPVVSICPINQDFNGAVGLPISHTEVSVRDGSGKLQPPLEPGELWVRGPQVMQAYWHQPTATAKVMTQDGWFKTGDIAYLDREGYIFLVDRLKDMINVSGLKVSSLEVEDVIAQLPQVGEVAVIAQTDVEHGEVVKACIVLKANHHITTDKIIRHCRKKLAAYKAPKVVTFYNELPKNHLGKVLKKELRQ